MNISDNLRMLNISARLMLCATKSMALEQEMAALNQELKSLQFDNNKGSVNERTGTNTVRGTVVDIADYRANKIKETEQ